MPKYLLVLSLAVASLACSGQPTAPSGSAVLAVRLTDAPFDDAKAVLVTFSTVTAHRSDSDWSTVPFTDGASSRTCDLKKLQGPQDVLGTGALAPGRCTMVRLVVASAALYFDNPSVGPACGASVQQPAGRSAAIEVPSGEVKLNRGFELRDGATTTMVLDLDGGASIRETGNGRYLMNPLISIVSIQ